MKKSDWGMEIIHKDNGYLIRYADGGEIIEEDVIQDSKSDELKSGVHIFLRECDVIQDSKSDELKSGEELLWAVIDHFCLGGSRYDKERLVIKREPGDKYEGKKGTVYKRT